MAQQAPYTIPLSPYHHQLENHTNQVEGKHALKYGLHSYFEFPQNRWVHILAGSQLQILFHLQQEITYKVINCTHLQGFTTNLQVRRTSNPQLFLHDVRIHINTTSHTGICIRFYKSHTLCLSVQCLVCTISIDMQTIGGV